MSTRPCTWLPAALLLFSAAAIRADEGSGGLKAPAEFDQIRNRTERSIAYFTEAGRILQHPRCLNCHPADRQPTQGDDLHAHVPPVHGGPEDRGTPELPCASCHGPDNTATLGAAMKSIPGADPWALAPASMAWQGLSLGEICVQLKDPARNGGRSLAKIEEHLAKDHLVGWAWHPGEGRAPAPGNQALFGELIAAWIKTGAHCPKP